MLPAQPTVKRLGGAQAPVLVLAQVQVLELLRAPALELLRAMRTQPGKLRRKT